VRFLVSSLAMVLLVLAQLAQAQVFTNQTPEAAPVKPRAAPKPRPQHTQSQQPAHRPQRAQLPQPAPRSMAQSRTFDDPAAYCTANPNADQIGTSYVGQPTPDWVANAATPAAQSAATGGTRPGGFTWRCANAKVLACYDYGGKADCAKPDQSREPTPELRTFCSANPNAEVPQSVIRNTVPVWTCRRGSPVITGYLPNLDERGFFASQWRNVTDFAPSNAVGSVPRSYVGTWKSSVRAMGYLFKIPYDVVFNLRGGNFNSVIGSVDYYTPNFSGSMAYFCSSELYLTSGASDRLELEERVTRRGPDGRCPVQGKVTLQPREGQLWIEWRKTGIDKVTISGWAKQ